MKLSAFRNTPAIVIATGALLLGASGGTVAAGLITGADIKDGTVTTKDVKNETLTLDDISAGAEAALQGDTGSPGTDGVSGWQMVTVLSDPIATGDNPASLRARSESSLRAYGNNTAGPTDTLVATVFCATVFCATVN